MNFRHKMLICLRNKVDKNIHEHLKKELRAMESWVSYEVVREVENKMVRFTAPSLIVDKCWSYEF